MLKINIFTTIKIRSLLHLTFYRIVSSLTVVAIDKPYYKEQTDLIDSLLADYEVSVRPVEKASGTVVVKLYPEIIRIEGIVSKLSLYYTAQQKFSTDFIIASIPVRT